MTISDADPLVILLFHLAILLCIVLRLHTTTIFAPPFTFYLCLLFSYGLLVMGDLERYMEWTLVTTAARRYSVNILTLAGFVYIVWRGDSRADQRTKIFGVNETLLKKLNCVAPETKDDRP